MRRLSLSQSSQRSILAVEIHGCDLRQAAPLDGYRSLLRPDGSLRVLRLLSLLTSKASLDRLGGSRIFTVSPTVNFN